MKVCIHSRQRLFEEALALLIEELGHEAVPAGDPDAEIGLWDLAEQAPPFPAAPPLPTLAIVSGEGEAIHALRKNYRGSIQAGDGAPVLGSALQAVRRGEIWADRKLLTRLVDTRHHFRLTRREQQTLQLLLQGHSNRRIAEELGIAEATVKMHVTHIFEKRGVSSRSELLAAALEARRGGS